MWKVEFKDRDDQVVEHDNVSIELAQFGRSDRGYSYGEDALQVTKDGEHIITIGFGQSMALHEGHNEKQRKFSFNDVGFIATGYELGQAGELPHTQGWHMVQITATNVQ